MNQCVAIYVLLRGNPRYLMLAGNVHEAIRVASAIRWVFGRPAWVAAFDDHTRAVLPRKR